MFRKLLKYDLKAIRSAWLIQAVILLAMSVPFGLAWRFLEIDHGNDMEVYENIAQAYVSIFVIWLVVSYLFVKVCIYNHFYKSFFTDEGYLTFTLPIARWKLLLAKTVNAIIWSGAQVLLYMVIVAVIMLLSPVPEKGSLVSFEFYRDVAKVFEELWQQAGAWLIVYLVQGLLIFCLAQMFSALIVYFCIAFGYIVAKKNKILAGVGMYFGIEYLISWAIPNNSIVVVFRSYNALTDELGAVSVIMGVIGQMNGGIHDSGLALLGTVILLVLAAFAITAYCVTLDLLERKLNLA